MEKEKVSVVYCPAVTSIGKTWTKRGRIISISLSCAGLKLVCHTEGRTQADCVLDWGAGEVFGLRR